MLVLDAMNYPSDGLARAAWIAYSIVSQGKSYTKTAPNVLYPDSGDAEMTNGTLATGGYPDGNYTAWDAPNDPNICIDLGAPCVLSDVRFHFHADNIYLIGAPATLDVYGSNDNIEFTLLDSFSGAGGDWLLANGVRWSNLLTVAGTYQYVRFNFSHSSNWIFLSEIQVNASSIIVYSEPSIKKEGSYSVKLVATQTASLNATVIRSLSPTWNLSGQDNFKFYAGANRVGSNFKIGLHDSGGTTIEVTPNIAQICDAAEDMQEVTLDLSAVADADKDAIDSITYTQLNADAETVVYLDWLRTLSEGEGAGSGVSRARVVNGV